MIAALGNGAETCRTRHVYRHVKDTLMVEHWFVAWQDDPQGGGYTLAESGRWLEHVTLLSRQNKRAVAVLEGLLQSLEVQGWERDGRGIQWYEVELKRHTERG